MPQLGQCFGFDLPDTLASDVEVLADFFQGALFAGLVEAEAHLDDLFLARSERRQHVLGQLAQVIGDGRLCRVGRPPILDEACYCGLAVIPDGSLERDRLLGDLQGLANLPRGHINPASELFVGRLAAKLLDHQPLGPENLVYDLDHVDRHPDRSALVSYRSSNGLPDPPGSIGRELVAAAPVEFLDGAHQPDIAFLNQVEEVQAAVDVVLCDRDHQPEVCLDHLALGLFDFGFGGDHSLEGALDVSGACAITALDFPDDLAGRPLLFFKLFDPSGSAAIEGALNSSQVPFRASDLCDDAFESADEAPPGACSKGIAANHLGQGYQLPGVLAPHPLEFPGALGLGLYLGQEFTELLVGLGNVGELGQKPLANLFALGFQCFFSLGVGGDVDHLLGVEPFFGELDLHSLDLLEGDEGARESFIDADLTALYPFSNSDFVFASEQRDGTHFAQVKPHRIQRLVLTGLQIYVNFFGFFDDFGGLLLIGGYLLPERLGGVLVDFGHDAFDPTSGTNSSWVSSNVFTKISFSILCLRSAFR